MRGLAQTGGTNRGIALSHVGYSEAAGAPASADTRQIHNMNEKQNRDKDACNEEGSPGDKARAREIDRARAAPTGEKNEGTNDGQQSCGER